MGRKGQNKPKQAAKAKNHHNLLQRERELNDYVDKLLRISTIPQQNNVLKALESQVEIEKIVDRIKSLEVNKELHRSIGNRCAQETIDRFKSWAVENGAKFEQCSICEFPGYELGLKAKSDVAFGKLILSVPRELMLTREKANESILKPLIDKDQILRNMPNVTLAIYLLMEKFKVDSFYKPYLDILPEKYSTVLYFTPEELEELKGSPTLETALRQIKSISRQYAYFQKIFNTSNEPVCRLLREHFTFNEYRWAVSTVMTRQNTIPSEDGSHMSTALIPLWDLCNHTNGTISTDYNTNSKRSECLALRDFKAGEQIFIFYGARNNADLFIHNGFVYEENDHDCYYLKLGVSKSDPLQERRTELLNVLLIGPSHEFCIRKTPEPIDGKLLAFARIFNMDEEQLKHWTENGKSSDLEYTECALDTALERKAWVFLQMRFKLILGTYRTSLEKDLDIIRQNVLSPNKILAVKMRASEKKIILNGLSYVEQHIKQ